MINEKTNENQHWSRRRFLSTVMSTAAGLVAAACGRNQPTPTPTATASPLPPATSSVARSPLATPTATPVVESSLLRSPTPTPAPNLIYELFGDTSNRVHLPYVAQNGPPTTALRIEPTFTPTPPKATATPRPPTATPTPMATRFPPGPPSKLGLHVERHVDELFDLLETRAVSVVKTLELDANFVARIKQTSPSTLVIGRLRDTAQIQLDSLDPLPAAREFVNRALAYADDPQRRPHFDGWEGYNEPVAANAEEMKRLADFEAERVRLLGERGIRSVIGNFGTGSPDIESGIWEFFLPAVREAINYNGWLGLHEYSAPTIYYASTREDQGRYPGVNPEDEGWLTLRYRKVYRQFLQPEGLTIPLIFTELGVDGVVLPNARPGPREGKGWRDFTQYWTENGYGIWGPGAYIEQLAWFDAAMRQDDYVVGGCIFTLGASNQWLSYDINGPALGILQQYLSVHAPA